MSDEESSFVILGSTPTPSMEQYTGHESSTTKENVIENGSSIAANMMQSTQTITNFSLLNPSLNSPSLSTTKKDSYEDYESFRSSVNYKPTNGLEASTASGGDFAEQFLLGEIPADSLKVSVKYVDTMTTFCPTFNKSKEH